MDFIAEILSRLSMAASGDKTSLCRVLPVRSCDAKKERPALSRNWSQVDQDLRKLFDLLAVGQKPWPLYLYGLEGRGKTRAVLCVCDAFDGVRYWTVSEVMDMMAAGRAPWTLSWGWGSLEARRFEKAESPSLAILDELGMHASRDFEFDAVKRFLDWREDQPAVYISNHPLTTMRKAYDGRIESRLSAGSVFELKGVDRRKGCAK